MKAECLIFACFEYSAASKCHIRCLEHPGPGQKSTSRSGFAVAEDEFLPLALSFSPDISLKDAIQALQVLTRMSPDAKPVDQTGDDKIGLEDAIYTLQVIGDLRGGSGPHTLSIMRVTLSESKTVKISKDTDGDGVDDWFKDAPTDEFGHLEVDGLENGTYSLTAISDEKAVRIENIKIVGRSVHLKTIRMKPVGSISGQALLEGASDHSEIHVFIPGTSFAAFTDSEGSFTISNVPEGTYDLKASKENYGTISLSEVAVESGKDLNIGSVELASTVGSVSGTVTLEGTSNYAGILVWLRTNAGTADVTTTSEAGEYTFVDIPVGTYDLVAAMPGYIAQKWAVTISVGQNEQELKVLKINSATGKLTGTVTLDNIDDYTGILVGLAGTQYMAVTGSSGAYTITEIPEGTYTVFMKAEGYKTKHFENIQITAGESTTLDGTLDAAARTKLGSIVGTACYTDKSEHAGISVKVEGTDIPLAGTDTNGGFIISNVPAGTYTLLFTQANYTTVTRMGVVVPPWDTVFIRAVEMVPPFGTIKGEVHLEGGPPHGNVTVSVDGMTIMAQSLDDGSFQLSPVPVGTYTVTAYKADYIQGQVTGVVVGPGQTVNLSSPIKLNKPPEPPTGVDASYLTGSSVKVTWNPSPSDDVVGYNVYYGTRSDEITVKANANLITQTAGGVWVYTVTNLSCGVDYYFAVCAFDDDRLESEPSASRHPDPVGEIEGLVQLEGESSHADVTVSLYGTTIMTQSAESGYFLLSPVPVGTYTITAYKAGYKSAHLSDVVVNPGQKTSLLAQDLHLCTPPEPPTGVTASQASGSSVNVEWTASVSTDVAGYNVYFSTRSDVIDQKANAELIKDQVDDKWQFEVTGLKKGVTYYVAVEAVDDDGLISVLSQSVWTEIVPRAPDYPEVSEITHDGAFSFPQDIVISRDNARAYVSNSGAASVSVIDLSSNEIIAYYLVGSLPTGTAFNPLRDEVYVLTETDFSVINTNDTIGSDLPDLPCIATIPGLALPKRCVVSPDGKYLFVSQHGTNPANSDQVYIFDLDTRANVLGEGEGVSVGSDPMGMAVANHELYVANSVSNTISVIDIDPNSPTKWQIRGTIGEMSHPIDVAVSPDEKYVYVANAYAHSGLEPDEVAVIDTATHTVIKRITVGNYPYRMATAGNMLYVTNYMDANVSMINMDTNEVLNTTFGVGTYPTGIAVTADGETIYVVNNGSQSVSIRIY